MPLVRAGDARRARVLAGDRSWRGLMGPHLHGTLLEVERAGVTQW